MGYVPEAKFDIFVSYARADDDAAAESERWVSRFVGDLRRAVTSRLGLKSDEKLEIFFDRETLQANDELAKLKEAARQSVVFVAIISPSYVMRNWTLQELETFCQ